MLCLRRRQQADSITDVCLAERDADEHAVRRTDCNGVAYCLSSSERDADKRADSSTDGDGSAVERARAESVSCAGGRPDQTVGITYRVSSPERGSDERADSSTDGLAWH